MVFERQSRQKGVGALPRNALPSSSAPTTTSSATAGATASASATASATSLAPPKPNRSSQPHAQPSQSQLLPPKQQQATTTTSSLLAGNMVTNKGLVTASLGLRSLLGSARASSIFLDNDSLILPSEHEDDDDYDDDSSLNLSLHTMGGGGGIGSSTASIGGSSVLTVANTVTEDPTSMFTSSTTSAQMIAAELHDGDVVKHMTMPQQQQQVATTGTTGGAGATTAATTTVQNKSAATTIGVRSWMTKTATITRSINNNNNHSSNNNYNITSPSNATSSNIINSSPMNASQAPTPAASGSRPPPPTTPAATAAAAASSSPPPTTPAAANDNDNDLKIVATASMITLDSTSPSANSTNSNNMKESSSTMTPRENHVILPNGTSTTTTTTNTSTMGLLLAPPSPQPAEDDASNQHCNHQDEENMNNPTITYYNHKSSQQRQRQPAMSTFCQYGPRWLKFLLIISIVFLLASIALVAVGVSMQYVEFGVANSNSPDGATSSAASTPVDDQAEEEERGGIISEPFIPTTGEDNANGEEEEPFNLSNAIANYTNATLPAQDEEENKEEEEMSILASASSPSFSPQDNAAISESSNSTDIPVNTTDTPTLAPTLAPTDAPSDVPTAMPSPMPSPRPSITPSGPPSNVPTDLPSTLAPSSLPSTTMQPSSLQPALRAPELHRPTVSEMPSDSPTATRAFSDIVTFYVLAGQWDENQSEMTLRGTNWLLENLPTQQQPQQDINRTSTAAFMVHLGDWNGPVGAEADREYELAAAVADDDVLPPALDCSEPAFIDTHLNFSTSSVPVYFTLGSREFGDCPDPEAALSSYRTWLQDYDMQYWNAPQWDVWNDGSSGYSENWIFSYNDIVFAGINLARGSGASSRDATSFMDDTEWENRYDATMDWINMNYYDFRRNNRVFCIFASSGPNDEANREFFDELLSRIEFRWIRMHFIIAHRNSPDEAVEAYNRRYFGIRNLDVISVQAAVWPPMRVEIDLSNIIRAEVSVEQSTWFDEYVELESL